jgi:FkbM family methyltransferase
VTVAQRASMVSFQYTRWWSDGVCVPIRLEVVHPDDVIAREIAKRATFFELDLLEHLALFGPRGGVFVDVGANIGNHSVFFGKFLAHHVVAIEPHPALGGILRRNLEANAIRNASVLPFAVGARRAEGRITPSAGRLNIGATRVVALYDAEQAAEQNPAETPDTVPVRPLDEALLALDPAAREQPVTLVKIDVEGMELDVLHGASELLSRQRPQLVIELMSEQARTSVRSFLTQFGYQDAGRRFCWTPTYHFFDPSVHRLEGIDRRTGVDEDVDLLQQLSDDLCQLVGAGETLILVDEEQCWAGLVIDGRRRLSFLEKDGEYWGPPADDKTAIDELERLRKAGAGYIAFPRSNFWWLLHYGEFHRYLRARFRCSVENGRLIAFDLRERAADVSVATPRLAL